MIKNKLQTIFAKPKPIIGMVHLGYFPGQKGFKSLNGLEEAALADIEALQENGIDGLILENWKESSLGEFVTPETTAIFAIVAKKLSKKITVPFGVNVLNNDYKSALSIAKLVRADFVQLDVFVDRVVSDFKYNAEATARPFIIKPNPKRIISCAGEIPLFVFIQPKHYQLLEPGKPIEKSARQAVRAGAAGLIVTKETGVAPTMELLVKAKAVSGEIPVGIGSGFSAQNASQLLPYIDFAIVGTALKVDNITDNPVDPVKVKQLMSLVEKCRL